MHKRKMFPGKADDFESGICDGISGGEGAGGVSEQTAGEKEQAVLRADGGRKGAGGAQSKWQEKEQAVYQISIVDDEQESRIYIEGIVRDWMRQRRHLAKVSLYESGEEFFFKEGNIDTDLLLLDIEMNAMNGVELAAKVRREDHRMQIIFITGYMEYLQEGYEVEALHYLLKPVTKEKLFPVLDRGIERLRTAGEVLIFSVKGEMVRLPLHEIRYLEVQKNYVTIHGKQDYEVKLPLAELEKKLDESFFRTGRSYLVNLRYVRQITKTEVLLENGSRVPLSRGVYEKINRAMIQYF